MDLIQGLPHLGVYGQIEETYIRSRKEEDFHLLKGDWPLTLRALTIPLSDKNFFMKSKDLRAMAASILGDRLILNVVSITNPDRISEFERTLGNKRF